MAGRYILLEFERIFQISYESETPNLTICDTQIDEFIDICRGKKAYKKGRVFELKSQGKYEANADLIPYFSSDGLLVSERLYFSLKEFLLGSGQWLECEYKKTKYFYFDTSVVLNAIDYDASGCKYIDGYLVSINPVVFKPLNFDSVFLFRVPREGDNKPIWLFATESFKKLFEQLSVKNIKFDSPKI